MDNTESERLTDSNSTQITQSLGGNNSNILSVCRICLSSLMDPACLTCGHKFCEKCLNQYWNIRQRPDFIICPLCRNCAFDVTFAEKEEFESTEDFRKTFNPGGYADAEEFNNARLIWLKISITIAAIYYIIKWTKPLFRFFVSHINWRRL